MNAPSASSEVHKQACTSCARRKIRCDRQQPCSNCVAQARIYTKRHKHRDGHPKGQEQDLGCVYVELAPVKRHRRKLVRTSSSALADGLLDRLRMYKDLLNKNGIAVPEAHAEKEPDCRQHTLPKLLSHDAREDDDSHVLVDDHIWIASPWEDKMAIRPGPASMPMTQTPASGTDTLVVSESASDLNESIPTVIHADAADEELRLWQSMPPELRNPPVSSIFARRFFGQRTNAERAAENRAVDLDHTTSLPVAYSILGTSCPVPMQHPEPRMILYLWQKFVDNVNPLIRILHVPTTHQQVADVSWDAANALPATGALLFAIYALALTSMTAKEYADMFASTQIGSVRQALQPLPPKSQLLTQYRRGAMQCLAETGLLTTRRIDVLQAFTLLILAEPDLELSSTLASIAVHLGRKMGLHREVLRTPDIVRHGSACGSECAPSTGMSPSTSFFQHEMSVRLWWQIRGIEIRTRQAVSLSYTNNPSSGNFLGCGTFPPPDLDDMRMPLNINDADLHPAMTCAPVEHTGPTEMLYLRVKYHTVLWMRAFAQKSFAGQNAAAASSIATPAGHFYRTHLLPAMKNSAIDELEQLYHEICHKHADPRIPLHAVSSGMARTAVAQLRFQAYHPRTSAAQPPLPTAAAGGSVYSAPAFSRHNADATFRHALTVLDKCFACRQVASIGQSFATFQLLADVVMRVIVDAAVYVVCMLRIRTGGGSPENEASIDSAWRTIELFFGEYGEDLVAAASDYEQHILDFSPEKSQPKHAGSEGEVDEENRKLAAGATFSSAFTDQTLEAWDARVQALGRNGLGSISTPAFIAKLQADKSAQQMSTEVPLAAVSGWGDVLYQEPLTDWEYWNNILQI
ncbi:hypothetical protein SEPCBS57363_004780 [Sporothrix epigloea]|uniref:Zn(2)-C6 fungal-type domain-containing protein n=1 Tax=Sporothrix epigloea TaxID=1892477 RepID=A0ABP0DTX1_9PEZI